MRQTGLIVSSAASLACLFLAGCSGASLPELAPEGTATLKEAPIVGRPTDIYARVARGALACWFGKAGPLRDNYVYHARAEPPAKGGKAKIVIHERDTIAEDTRGLRTFRISIVPDGESSRIGIENLKMPEGLSETMENDVHRWARGDVDCADANSGWAPKPPNTKNKPPSKTGRERAT